MGLTLSLVAQVIAGIAFFADKQQELQEEKDLEKDVAIITQKAKRHKRMHKTAYVCVGLVTVINVLVGAFDVTLTPPPHQPHTGMSPTDIHTAVQVKAHNGTFTP